jgi:ArsR family transcriptional regulator
MTTLSASVGLLGLLADPTRVRLLALLEREELTVAELVGITGLAQSRVSTHLGRLRDAGLLRVRPSGASAYHALNEGMPDEARGLWQVIRGQLSDAVVDADGDRRAAVVRARAGDGGWLDAVAGEMERHYSPGRTWESLAHGLLALATLGDVLDAGSGDGFVASLVAPRAASVTCVDRSERMIDAARRRLAGHKNVRLAVGDLHELPFPAGSFDQVLLFSVLTYSLDPGRALSEGARVLRTGGRLAVLTLNAHSHEAVTALYGHAQAGFRAGALRRLLGRAGLTVESCAVVARERRAPHFELLAACAAKRRAGPGQDSA